MACERQSLDLARMKHELDQTLDKFTAYLDRWNAGLQEVRKGYLADAVATVATTTTTIPSLSVKAVLPKLHVHRHTATGRPVDHHHPPAGSKNGDKIVNHDDGRGDDDLLEAQVVGDRSDGSTFVSYVDGSWTYINSPRTGQSSYVLLPSQTSSVAADVRVNANDDVAFSSSPPSLSAEDSGADMRDIGSWLTAQSVRWLQTSGDGHMSIEEDVGVDAEIKTLAHDDDDGAMHVGGLADHHHHHRVTPRGWVGYSGGEPTAEVGDTTLIGGYFVPYRDDAPWTPWSVVGA